MPATCDDTYLRVGVDVVLEVVVLRQDCLADDWLVGDGADGYEAADVRRRQPRQLLRLLVVLRARTTHSAPLPVLYRLVGSAYNCIV